MRKDILKHGAFCKRVTLKSKRNIIKSIIYLLFYFASFKNKMIRHLKALS